MLTSEVFAVPVELVGAGETDRGSVRAINEDSVLVRTDLSLYVVADGAGGHNAGNVASAIATTAVAKHIEASESTHRDKPERDQFGLWTGARRLCIAVQRANAAVIEIAQTSHKYRGMGTTIVCALFTPSTGRLHLAHAGDSRCYRLRAGRLECLTLDHSMLTDLVEQFPEVEDEVIARLPRKAVTRALGMEPTLRVSVSTSQSLPGDRYLLCSDGLTGEVSEPMIAEALGAPTPASDIAGDLVRLAKEAGGRDNVTALVVECGKGTGQSVPPPLPPTRRESRAPDIAVEEVEAGPEILMLRAHGGTFEASEPSIRVVPAGKVDEQMIRALDRMAPALGGTRRCVRCSLEMESWTALCPRCGFSNEEPSV